MLSIHVYGRNLLMPPEILSWNVHNGTIVSTSKSFSVQCASRLLPLSLPLFPHPPTPNSPSLFPSSYPSSFLPLSRYTRPSPLSPPLPPGWPGFKALLKGRGTRLNCWGNSELNSPIITGNGGKEKEESERRKGRNRRGNWEIVHWKMR